MVTPKVMDTRKDHTLSRRDQSGKLPESGCRQFLSRPAAPKRYSRAIATSRRHLHPPLRTAPNRRDGPAPVRLCRSWSAWRGAESPLSQGPLTRVIGHGRSSSSGRSAPPSAHHRASISCSDRTRPQRGGAAGRPDRGRAFLSGPVGGDVAQRAARHSFDRKHDRLNLKADARSATLLTWSRNQSGRKTISSTYCVAGNWRIANARQIQLPDA